MTETTPFPTAAELRAAPTGSQAEHEGGDDAQRGGDLVPEAERQSARPCQLQSQTRRSGKGEEHVEPGKGMAGRHGGATNVTRQTVQNRRQKETPTV